MAILLITATVTPPRDAIKLARSNPADRLGDYLTAFRFYLKKMDQGVFDSIVFTENSDSNITDLKAISLSAKRPMAIEFISFNGLDYPSHYGRAFGEMRLIDYCMQRSEIIRSATADEIIWKVTGRYIIENIDRLVLHTRKADLYCQCRDFPMPWADMYFIGWKKGAFATTLSGAGERIREGRASVSSEVEFRRLIDEKATTLNVTRRFREPPYMSGIRGYDNRRYEKQKVKLWLRGTLARLAPWIWI